MSRHTFTRLTLEQANWFDKHLDDHPELTSGMLYRNTSQGNVIAFAGGSETLAAVAGLVARNAHPSNGQPMMAGWAFLAERILAEAYRLEDADE